MPFELHTFGTADLRAADGRVLHPLIAQPKRFALLVYLAIATPRGFHRRDVLVGLLWPELDQQHARSSLRKAVYHIRRSLGDGVLIGRGEEELGLAADTVWCDVVEFEALLAERRAGEALDLYRGDLLEAFFLPDTPAFERWLDGARERLRRRSAEAAWLAAAEAEAAGHTAEALSYGRRAIALSPDDEAGVRRLLSMHDRAGDAAGACRVFEDHSNRLAAEFELEPAPNTRALLDRIRSRPAAAPSLLATDVAARDPGAVTAEYTAGTAANAAVPASAAPAGGPPPAPRPAATRRWLVASLAVVSILVATGGFLLFSSAKAPHAGAIAIGYIQDHSQSDDAAGGVLSDLLSTNLARVPALRVVSNTRMYEVLGTSGADATAYARAARRAGAAELVEGSVYRLANGRLRLDLRTVTLASGRVRFALSVEGGDLFALVDQATGELAAALGRPAGMLRVADVTTHSLAAYRLYEQGLRAFYERGDARAAWPLFVAALREDSTFAMAAYFAARSAEGAGEPSVLEYLDRAIRLASRAGDRERLLILARRYAATHEPQFLAVAETLAARFPTDPEALRTVGAAMATDGDFAAAARHYQRAFALDSSAMLGGSASCGGCEALYDLAATWTLADSLHLAERSARLYIEMRPQSPVAWAMLAGVLDRTGRYDESNLARRRAHAITPSPPMPLALYEAEVALRRGDFDEADRQLAFVAADTDPALRAQVRWWTMIGLRYRGRHRDALALAREHFRIARQADGNGSGGRMSEAIILFEMGRAREAAELFRTIAAAEPDLPPGKQARHRAWYLTHAATARAAAGDTAGLAAVADTIQAIGLGSAWGRDRRLHHHVRGLIASAQGRPADAEREFRAAIYSPSDGYTRTNLELARLLLDDGRPHEAAALLGAALRGAVQASNLYVSRTELHEALALALDAAGRPDSAAVHYRHVANAWQDADPPLHARRQHALARTQRLDGIQQRTHASQSRAAVPGAPVP